MNEYLNSLAGEIRNTFLKARLPLLKMSVKQIDAFVTNSLLTDKVAPAQAPQSIVESVAETADDNNIEMIDNDGVKDNEETENGDKMATIEQVTETPSRSPSSVIRLVVAAMLVTKRF